MEKFTKVALAKELIDAHPNAAKRALARRLHHEHPEVFRDIEQARLVVRSVCGAQGELHRKQLKTRSDRPLGKAGWKPELPPSDAEPWDAIQIDGPCKILSLSDIHVPYHVPAAVEAAVAYAKKKFRPDILLLNGDTIDFAALSRWEKSPKERDAVREVDKTEALIEWLESQFPKARKIFKAGNHDERWDKYIWNHAPALWGLENMRLQDMLHLSDYGFEFVGDQRPIIGGSLPIFHGHEIPNTGSQVNPGRGVFLKLGGTGLIGHCHRTSDHPEYNWKKREIVCWSQGCLCDLHPRYAKINKWNWGACVVEVYADNSFDVHNFRLSSDFKVRAS